MNEVKTFELRDMYDEMCSYAESHLNPNSENSENALSTLWVRLMDICKHKFDDHSYATSYTLDGNKILLDSLILKRPTIENGVVRVHLLINDEEYVPPHPVSTFTEDKVDELSSKFRENVLDYFHDKYLGKPDSREFEDSIRYEAKLLFNIRNYIDASNKEILQYISKLDEEIKELKNLIIEKGDNA